MKKAILICAVFGALLFAAVGCGSPSASDPAGVQQGQSAPSQTDASAGAVTEESDIFADCGFASMALSSNDLHDGVWDTVITDTDNGSNVSPQLSWEPVEGAQSYVIYMVDTTAMDWMHWKSANVTETVLPQGWASAEEYIGPYPPSGTHDYEIYVFALAQPVEKVKGSFNFSNLKFKDNALALDEAQDGSAGNILAYGHITGTYTHGD